ncbi:MAG TPA: glycosyltransferase family 2 protein [Candidatus Limnocylindria bacterium]
MTDAARPRLTIFFPAFNEEENVAETVRRALDDVGPLVDGSIEVLIVDDGSTDRTPELADALAAADARVRVHHQANRGYGGALRAGFENATGELIGFSDCDLQFDLREMARFLERLDDASRGPVDAVIGYRLQRRDPPHRMFIAKAYNAIVSAAFGLRVRDIDCAMKLFRREAFDGLRLEADSPFLSAELLIKLRARGERIAQLGVTHYPRAAGQNTGASFRKIMRTFRDIGKLRLAMWTRRAEVLGTPRTAASLRAGEGTDESPV